MSKNSKLIIGALGLAGGLIALGGGVGTKIYKDKSIELASTPKDLSWKSWKAALLETKDAVKVKNVSMLAGGIAYFGVLAFFPFIAAMVAIAGLTINPENLQEITSEITNILPRDIGLLITTMLSNSSGQESAGIWVAIIGIGVSIFSISGAVQNVINALNVMYNTEENRGMIKLRLTSLALTLVTIIAIAIFVPIIALGGDFMSSFGIPGWFITFFSFARWLILGILAMLGMAILFRYAPDRPRTPKWQWVSWGAIIATILWMIATAAFFIYLQYFANFSDSYSIFAGIIALMLWLNLSSTILLLGASVNYRLEKQTASSTLEN